VIRSGDEAALACANQYERWAAHGVVVKGIEVSREAGAAAHEVEVSAISGLGKLLTAGPTVCRRSLETPRVPHEVERGDLLPFFRA